MNLRWQEVYTAQKMKTFINDFFSKCDQIRGKLRIWSYLLKEILYGKLYFLCRDMYVGLEESRHKKYWARKYQFRGTIVYITCVYGCVFVVVVFDWQMYVILLSVKKSWSFISSRTTRLCVNIYSYKRRGSKVKVVPLKSKLLIKSSSFFH